MVDYGILMLPGMRRKPRHLLNALLCSARAHGLSAKHIERYETCKVLVLYGWGGAGQQRAMRLHKGHYVALDLGYWERNGLDRSKWRVSINGFHCPRLMMQGDTPPISRLLQSQVTIKRDRRRDGPVLMIGNAPKSVTAIAGDWAARKSREIKNLWPDKQLIYRPKPGRAPEKNVLYDGISTGDINHAISKASVIVCRHSNVAVDACLMGVPVVAEDGAGAAIYPHRLEDWENQPSFQQREDFIQRLAWWQWSAYEIRQGKFWPWLEARLRE